MRVRRNYSVIISEKTFLNSTIVTFDFRCILLWFDYAKKVETS